MALAEGRLRSETCLGLWLDPAAWLAANTSRVLDVLHVGLASEEQIAFARRLADPGR